MELKLTLDGRLIAGKGQVLLGVIPLNTNLLVQSCYSTFSLLLIEADESNSILQQECKNILQEMLQVSTNGFMFAGNKIDIDFFMTLDMKSMWEISNLR